MKVRKYIMCMMLGMFTLFCQSCDDDDEKLIIAQEVNDAFIRLYPQAERVEWDVDGAYYVAEFIDHGIEKEARFSGNGTWLYTTWEVRLNSLPQAVLAALHAAYANSYIDDADFVETPTVAYYLMEVKQGNKQFHVRVTAAGDILKD